MKKRIIAMYLAVTFLMAIMMPCFVFAKLADVVVTASITAATLKDSYEPGESFVVSVDLTTCGAGVGNVYGFMSFDKEKLDISRTKKGGLSSVFAQGEVDGDVDQTDKLIFYATDE